MAATGQDLPLKLSLPDGRKIAYLEKGASADSAKHALLILHGLGSSRLANLPGCPEELLQEFGVRMVSIDRWGYGRSDDAPHLTLQSAAHDIAAVGDALALGPKFWLLGYSGGGAYCWAAARYIPQRIAGIAMWAPVGCYHWKGITEEERNAMMKLMTSNSRTMLTWGGRVPHWLVRFYIRHALVLTAGDQWVRRCQVGLSPPDREYLADPQNAEALRRDNLESLAAGGHGAGMAKDLQLFHGSWKFEPADIAEGYKGPIHIWQGTDDWLVPLGLQQWVANQVPQTVTLHELLGEGHLSWFCHKPEHHRQVLSVLFPTAEESTAQEPSGGAAPPATDDGASDEVTSPPVQNRGKL